MISITIYKTNHQYRGFCSEGHAGYAEEGYDIICSAVSVLTINTINSLEEFTEDQFEVEEAEDGGFLKMKLNGEISVQADILMKSLVLGLQTIQESYGSEYISLKFENCR